MKAGLVMRNFLIDCVMSAFVAVALPWAHYFTRFKSHLFTLLESPHVPCTIAPPFANHFRTPYLIPMSLKSCCSVSTAWVKTCSSILYMSGELPPLLVLP